MPEDRNVLDEESEVCSVRPMSGFYRTGCCETGPEHVGELCPDCSANWIMVAVVGPCEQRGV
jgi:uncharacterized protein